MCPEVCTPDTVEAVACHLAALVFLGPVAAEMHTGAGKEAGAGIARQAQPVVGNRVFREGPWVWAWVAFRWDRICWCHSWMAGVSQRSGEDAQVGVVCGTEGEGMATLQVEVGVQAQEAAVPMAAVHPLAWAWGKVGSGHVVDDHLAGFLSLWAKRVGRGMAQVMGLERHRHRQVECIG